MKRSNAWRSAMVLLFGCTAGCDTVPSSQQVVREAQLGVFFGGQIQQREELARALDGSQSQGFRLVFAERLTKSHRISWEIEMPAGSRGAAKQVQVTKLGEVTVPVGQSRIDQAFSFEPGDPLGVWNVRVLVDDELVIDRAWLVFDAASRRRIDADD